MALKNFKVEYMLLARQLFMLFGRLNSTLAIAYKGHSKNFEDSPRAGISSSVVESPCFLRFSEATEIEVEAESERTLPELVFGGGNDGGGNGGPNVDACSDAGDTVDEDFFTTGGGSLTLVFLAALVMAPRVIAAQGAYQ
ncbi:unnamed protein product [Callosobruchus maculatus]|uniref:Uncharacterized protein n=1 Tax=Callosobruchus maculatus TaxID=64391 RepID=A0A653DVE8_CALMS|nr:unnamed protein product [Callosobruchus maculatus]